MKLMIDSRETALYQHLYEIFTQGPACPFPLQVVKETILIGDVHIINDDDQIELVIERKTTADLASSLSDGRWSEQKKRALAHFPCTKLMYMIEMNSPTDIFHYQNRFSRVNGDAVLSAIMNLTMNHHIPSVFLFSTEQVAKYIYKLCGQYYKKKTVYDKKKDNTNYDESYVASISSRKQENMTSETYFMYCLQGIPHVSSKTARQIMALFDNSFLSFMDTIRDVSESAFSMLYKKKHGRCLSKTVIHNMYNLFLSSDRDDVKAKANVSPPLERQDSICSTTSLELQFALSPKLI